MDGGDIVQNHRVYKQLRQKIISAGYGPEQIAGITRKQAEALCESKLAVSDSFLSNAKALLANEAEQAEFKKVEDFFKSFIGNSSILQKKFPSLKVARLEKGGQRYIIIALDGQPELQDEEVL